MKYPQLISSLVYKRLDENTFIVKDCSTDNTYQLTEEAVSFMNRLDGKTNPYSINPAWTELEVRRFLRFLGDPERQLIRKKRIERNGLLSLRLPLFKIRSTEKMRLTAFFLNLALMLLFVPLLVAGGFAIFSHIDNLLNSYSEVPLYIGIGLGAILGLTLHEFGHAIAGLSFGARVFEAGLLFGLATGAYVLIDESNLKSKLRRVQIMGAGIEVNLSLFGAFGIGFALFKPASVLFFGIAITNLLLAMLNLLFVIGLDGSKILDLLIGEDFLCITIEAFFDKDERKRLISQGLIGYIKLGACAIGAISQLAYPLLIAIEIISWGGLFS